MDRGNKEKNFITVISGEKKSNMIPLYFKIGTSKKECTSNSIIWRNENEEMFNDNNNDGFSAVNDHSLRRR